VNAITPQRYCFGRYDRITIGGAHYRVIDKVDGKHRVQLVTGNVLEPHIRLFTDLEITEFMRRGTFRLEEKYFSKAHSELLLRTDDSNLLALPEEELRTIDWKVEWCRRFFAAQSNPNYAIKVNLSPQSLRAFIVLERDWMDRWYFRKYGERRGPGRLVVPEGVDPEVAADAVKERKSFDYPSHSALWNWLSLYKKSGYRREAFRTNYKNCGRRRQLDPEVEKVVQEQVQGYKDRRRPTGADIYDRVEPLLEEISKRRPALPALKVSRTTIYNRIGRLNPFEVELAREGHDRTIRKYSMVGAGNDIEIPMERVEMDDWECDLFALAEKSSIWKKMDKKARDSVPRVRCTITIGIDCATRSIVALNVSELAPSTPAVRAAISTMVSPKDRLAAFGGADSTWPMTGRAEVLATDGGPVFDNDEVNNTLAHCGIKHMVPEQDPRKRGTIEAFFRVFKRLCRRFAGQSFASVVERRDYPAEEMASLTFEAFYRAVIRFIVDVYHHSKHRGLERQTPYGAWRRLTEKHDMAPCPSTLQQVIAFGFRADAEVTLDKHGLLVQGVSYTSDALGELMKLVGHGARLPVFVNPHDLGSILVYVEPDHRPAISGVAGMKLFGEFLEVSSFLPDFQGVTIVDRLLASKAVSRLVEEDEAIGRKFRIAANAYLFDLGLQTMRDVGMHEHRLTQDDFDRSDAVIEHLSNAGLNGAPHPDVPPTMAEGKLGRTIGKAKKTRSTKDIQAEVEKLNRAPLTGQPTKAEVASKGINPEFLRSANMEGEDE
jgi:hypothetical protein